MFCPNCGFGVPDSEAYHFCPKCGAHIVVPDELRQPAAPAPSPVPAAGETLPKRILIVEDDLFIRELYQKQLQMAGYDVEVAVDGLEGRDKVLAGRYDLLLLDIMLPKMNGLDLLKNIKENEQKRDLPVIILSNLGQDAVVEKGLSLGAINYIVKADITPIEMLRVIQERIGK